MGSEKTTWRVTITSLSGEPLFALLVEREPVSEPAAAPSSPGAPAPAPGRPVLPPRGGDNEPKMTEPQKRYLFRLLALQGVEGDAAEDHLKEYFQVKSLKEISKAAASELINQMVKDQKEVGDGRA